jgi:hypothetical protein
LGSPGLALKKSLTPTVSSPAVGADIESQLLDLLSGGVDSPVAIAIGTSEGTRTPDGGKTTAWASHADPGNGARNQGSFSYQHSAGTPEDADAFQIQKFRLTLLPKFLKILPRLKQRTTQEIKFLFLCACDVYTQSEAACLAEGGFLDQIFVNANYSATIGNIADWRLQSYYDPETGKLDAPGFGNHSGRLLLDQKRRCEAVQSAAIKLGIMEAISR